MKTISHYLLLACALAVVSPVYADKSYYDQQEEIRRAADKLVEHDRKQREEARLRADAKEYRIPSRSSRYRERSVMERIGSTIAFLIFGGAVLVAWMWFFS